MADLTDEEIDALFLFGTDDDHNNFVTESYDPATDFVMPTWLLALMAFGMGILLCVVIFYVSYRQEWRCGVHYKEPPAEQQSDDLEEAGTKTFRSTLDDTEITGTSDSFRTKSERLVRLSTVPRCVLCSQNYTSGDHVTHSPACPHEYHKHCLTKHWTKNKKTKGKCPVCKETYVLSSHPTQVASSSAKMDVVVEEEEVQPFSSGKDSGVNAPELSVEC